jgi:uncharacterized protein (DUF433 family)
MLNYSAAVDYSKIITIEPGKRSGKPCIRGMRITVQDVFEYLAGGMTEDQILEDFPELTREDIKCLLRLCGRPRAQALRGAGVKLLLDENLNDRIFLGLLCPLIQS